MIQSENQQGFHIDSLQATLKANASFKSTTFSLGAKLSRHNYQCDLREPGAYCELNGFYLINGEQHTDTHAKIEHHAPNCESDLLYKGIADDKSHAVFNGKVVVHEAAQKTQSNQTNQNLLLSNAAEIDTKPELEIYADDVKCAHGATVGRVRP